jgi:dihydrolipoamide dehydrogenase
MTYDLAIIGSGPAGIACAKHGARYKLKTVIFEKNKENFGGTCLNFGCIPTKFFLNCAKIGKTWKETVNLNNEIVSKIRKSMLAYFEKTGIEIIFSPAAFLSENTLEAGTKRIEAKNIVIATGARPQAISLPIPYKFGEQMFYETDIGQKFLIIGAGYIGIEFACLLNAFGKNVTVIEKLPQILPSFDSNISSRLKTILERKSITIDTDADISNYKLNEYDQIIVCIGRRPNIEDLGIERTAIFLDQRGFVQSDKTMQTNIKNIYACGDINGKRLLAYVAEYQAQICIENIIGQPTLEDYSSSPECVFSIPQVSRVGLSEQEAKNKNINYRILKSNFLKFSSAYIYNDLDGFAQLIVDERHMIIGAHIISNFASELIGYFSLAIVNKMTFRNFKDLFLVHPTMSEIIPALMRESS